MKLSERELEKNILYLDTVQEAGGQTLIYDLLRCMSDHLKHSSPYNCHFIEREEMFKEIEEIIENWR